MNFSFENQGSITYLVYTVQNSDSIDSMSLGMLTNNRIAGLAQTSYTQMDTTKYIKYNVSAKVSVKQFFSGSVNKARLLGVFSGIVDGLLAAEDYMIDPASILLDLDYIFADVSTCETVLICLPVIFADMQQKDLGAFFKNIMFTTQFEQTENCDHVAKIINFLNASPVFSLINFKRLLDEIKGTPAVENAPSEPAKAVAEKPIGQAQMVSAAGQKVSAFSQGVAYGQATSVPGQGASMGQMASSSGQIASSYGQSAPAQGMQPGVVATPSMSGNPVGQPQKTTAQPAACPQGKAFVQPTVQAPQQSFPQPMQTNGAAGEKQISMFGLLMHYSKENKELYQQQKNAKKAQKASAAVNGQMLQQAPVKKNEPKPAKQHSTPKASQVNAAASRSMNNPGFAIPGQPAPAPTQAPASNLAGQNRPATSQPGPAAFPRQAAPQQAMPRQAAPQQAYPQQAMPRQAAPQQAMPQQAMPRQAAPQQAVSQQAYPQQAMPRQAAPQPAYTPRPIPQGQTANFGETTVLGGAANGETTVLNMANNPAQMIAPHLIRKKSNEKISINKPVFRVGKERSYVDYFIGDNTAISRSHANFITRDGEYFVVDTNSTNHTFVNGRMIQSNVETKISHGDTVRLANEDFAFRMY